MAKKPAKLANRQKNDASKPVFGQTRIFGDVCNGYLVVTNPREENGEITGDFVSERFENMWDAINLRNTL